MQREKSGADLCGQFASDFHYQQTERDNSFVPPKTAIKFQWESLASDVNLAFSVYLSKIFLSHPTAAQIPTS